MELSRRNFVLGGVSLSGALLAGCQTAPSSGKQAELTYSHLPSYQLLVSEIVIEQAYVSPGQSPNVEHLFNKTPAEVAERWAQDRLQAMGNDGVLNFIIKNASVTETKLERQTGITGLVTYDQSERYDGVIEIEMQVRDGRGYKDAQVFARAERSKTVPENLTLREREKVWFKITEDLMIEIDRQLQQGIAKHLSSFVM
ncbi:hypothetical protein [Kiloniella laminariae]|uniref:hypothetical protein n=1 Tax=Kiloniella laminariae TaxID=454162 RepID=UPI00039D6F93|nr:hypothetical protein [Kiloniella laminariae]